MKTNSPKPESQPSTSTFRSIVASDKPPFIVSIYFAALAWLFTHFVAVVSNQNLVEYHALLHTDPTTMKKFSEIQTFKVALTNIGNARLNELKFTINSKFLKESKKYKLLNTIVSEAPATKIEIEDNSVQENRISYKIEAFHPGQVYTLVAAIKKSNCETRSNPDRGRYFNRNRKSSPLKCRSLKSGDIDFRFNGIGGEKPVKLVKKSIWTWGIKHQGELLVGFVTFWGLATIWTLYVGLSSRKSSGQE